jgi:hypothetical protein
MHIDKAIEMAIRSYEQQRTKLCRLKDLLKPSQMSFRKIYKTAAALKWRSMDPETQVGPLSSEEALQDIDQVKRFEEQVQNCHRWKTSFEEGAYATNFINQFKGRVYILRKIIRLLFL